MSFDNCFFCDVQDLDDGSIVEENDHFYVHRCDFPSSPGHYEVIAKEHIQSFSDLTPGQVISLADLVRKTKEIIEVQLNPDGYNIGLNEGEAAGQSIPHLHVHIIPRYKGDVENPRGGVRNILPGGDYIDDVSREMPDRKKYLK